MVLEWKFEIVRIVRIMAETLGHLSFKITVWEILHGRDRILVCSQSIRCRPSFAPLACVRYRG
jgi:hypothetical protein